MGLKFFDAVLGSGVWVKTAARASLVIAALVSSVSSLCVQSLAVQSVGIAYIKPTDCASKRFPSGLTALRLRGAGMPAAARGGSYPPRHSNKVQGFIGGKDSFSAIAAAVDGAEKTIFASICFHDADFRFPDGRSLVQLVSSAATRGVKVCVLIWDNPRFNSRAIMRMSENRDNIMDQLADVPNIAFRWHFSPEPPHCHHMKAWLIDVTADEGEGPGTRQFPGVAFIGSANLQLATVNDGHASETLGRPTVHDTYLSVSGPCSADIMDLCRKRWISAASALQTDSGLHLESAVPSGALANDLTPRKLEPGHECSEPVSLTYGRATSPEELSSLTGLDQNITAQVVCTLKPEVISCDPRLHEEGEDSILEAYLKAIDSAETSIYIENQHFFHGKILDSIRRACERGVEIFCLVPGSPMGAVVHEKALSDKYSADPAAIPRPRYHGELVQLAELSNFPNFNLAILLAARNVSDGPAYRSIYVHSKVTVVDGLWITCGSANIVDLSMDKDHTEANIVVWDEAFAMHFLCDLARTHSDGLVTQDLTTEGYKQDCEVVKSLSQLARSNAAQWNMMADLGGFVVSVEPGFYASSDYLEKLRKSRPSVRAEESL